MTPKPIRHGSFVVERPYPSAVEREAARGVTSRQIGSAAHFERMARLFA